ncbi:HEAT repeat domain-containing protein, partial [Candidatus Omnitrophota bacterium]
ALVVINKFDADGTINSLVEIGIPAIPVFSAALNRQSIEKVIDGLSRIGNPALSWFITMLQDERLYNKDVSHKDIIRALNEMEATEEQIIDGFIAASKQGVPSARMGALEALGEFIRFGKAQNALKQALKDENQYVRETASRILKRLESGAVKKQILERIKDIASSQWSAKEKAEKEIIEQIAYVDQKEAVDILSKLLVVVNRDNWFTVNNIAVKVESLISRENWRTIEGEYINRIAAVLTESFLDGEYNSADNIEFFLMKSEGKIDRAKYAAFYSMLSEAIADVSWTDQMESLSQKEENCVCFARPLASTDNAEEILRKIKSVISKDFEIGMLYFGEGSEPQGHHYILVVRNGRLYLSKYKMGYGTEIPIITGEKDLEGVEQEIDVLRALKTMGLVGNKGVIMLKKGKNNSLNVHNLPGRVASVFAHTHPKDSHYIPSPEDLKFFKVNKVSKIKARPAFLSKIKFFSLAMVITILFQAIFSVFNVGYAQAAVTDPYTQQYHQSYKNFNTLYEQVVADEEITLYEVLVLKEAEWKIKQAEKMFLVSCLDNRVSTLMVKDETGKFQTKYCSELLEEVENEIADISPLRSAVESVLSSNLQGNCGIESLGYILDYYNLPEDISKQELTEAIIEEMGREGDLYRLASTVPEVSIGDIEDIATKYGLTLETINVDINGLRNIFGGNSAEPVIVACSGHSAVVISADDNNIEILEGGQTIVLTPKQFQEKFGEEFYVTTLTERLQGQIIVSQEDAEQIWVADDLEIITNY